MPECLRVHLGSAAVAGGNPRRSAGGRQRLRPWSSSTRRTAPSASRASPVQFANEAPPVRRAARARRRHRVDAARDRLHVGGHRRAEGSGRDLLSSRSVSQYSQSSQSAAVSTVDRRHWRLAHGSPAHAVRGSPRSRRRPSAPPPSAPRGPPAVTSTSSSMRTPMPCHAGVDVLEVVGDVEAGLDGEHHAGLERARGVAAALVEADVVHVHAEPVAGAVHVHRLVELLLDDFVG